MTSSAPLQGIRVLELGGIGPVPHAGLVLSMLGAEVLRIERPGVPDATILDDLLLRGATVVRADLKDPTTLGRVRELVATCDVVLEGFRPGVAERLGLGPEDAADSRADIVYGRMTGWGQYGPLAGAVGHDINYIGLTGALASMGDDGPVPPLNLVGDFGGGSMFLVAGVVAALLRRERTGLGDIVDASIVDGTSVLMQLIWSLRAGGAWSDRRVSNQLDGGAPYYRTYACADGGFMAVGAIEPQFFAVLLATLGLEPAWSAHQDDRARWPELTALISHRFAARSRAEWEALFAAVDACVTPVLDLSEVAGHPHVTARGSVRVEGDTVTSGPAPRFAGSPPPTLPEPVLTDLDGALRPR